MSTVAARDLAFPERSPLRTAGRFWGLMPRFPLNGMPALTSRPIRCARLSLRERPALVDLFRSNGGRCAVGRARRIRLAEGGGVIGVVVEQHVLQGDVRQQPLEELRIALRQHHGQAGDDADRLALLGA